MCQLLGTEWKKKTVLQLPYNFVLMRHPLKPLNGVNFLRISYSSRYLPPGRTCNVDGVDEFLRDFVPNVHQAGRVDNNVGPPGGLQDAVVICDVSLDDLHFHLVCVWNEKETRPLLHTRKQRIQGNTDGKKKKSCFAVNKPVHFRATKFPSLLAQACSFPQKWSPYQGMRKYEFSCHINSLLLLKYANEDNYLTNSPWQIGVHYSEQ